MKTVNKVTLLGAVGQDPEMRTTAQGLSIASFSLATSEKRKDKDEVTQWHNCVAFGKLADIISQYVVKGSKLYLEGTINYQQYDKDGEKRFATKIVVNEVSMLSSNDNQTKPPAKQSKLTYAETSNDDMDDDIPF